MFQSDVGFVGLKLEMEWHDNLQTWKQAQRKGWGHIPM